MWGGIGNTGKGSNDDSDSIPDGEDNVTTLPPTLIQNRKKQLNQ